MQGKPSVKESLFQSGRALFARKGYQGTTVEEIVQGASASKGSFYWYYKDKFSLFETILLHRARRTLEIWNPEGPWKSLGEALRDMGNRQIDDWAADPDGARIGLHSLAESIGGDERFTQIHRSILEQFATNLLPRFRRAFPEETGRGPNGQSFDDLAPTLFRCIDGIMAHFALDGDMVLGKDAWRNIIAAFFPPT